MGKVPFRAESWFRKSDSISVKVTVMPELWWETRRNTAFAEAKQNMLGDPKVKFISERDYMVDGCPAYSMVAAHQGDKSFFQRTDYVLVKPDLHVVIYTSVNESALKAELCEGLFKSISIKLRER